LSLTVECVKREIKELYRFSVFESFDVLTCRLRIINCIFVRGHSQSADH